LLKGTDYTTSGSNTVILSTAAALNDIIEVVTITNLNSIAVISSDDQLILAGQIFG
jgi:hypothetical protein